MKKILFALTVTLIITSCRSIDKMVESGNYDQALRFGIDKLRGEKDKKTKYVKGLEKAYSKLTNQDLDKIKELELRGNKRDIDKVISIYQNMYSRQNYIQPLLPLVSEDGYYADFLMKDYITLINKNKVKISELYYASAVENLKLAELHNSKTYARKAHSEFIESNKYFDDFKMNSELKHKAYELGQTHILIENYINGSNNAFYHTAEILNEIEIGRMNTTWKKYYTTDHGQKIDYIATIEVGEIYPGREKERYNSFTNTKEVSDGKRVKKTKNGKAKKDTTGKIIYIEKMITVSANIEELLREKISQMSGKVVIVHAVTNNHINTIPINVTHIFEDYSFRVNGDKRALTSEYKNRIKERCEPFPTDYEMTTNLAYEYKSIVENSIKNEKLI